MQSRTAGCRLAAILAATCLASVAAAKDRGFVEGKVTPTGLGAAVVARPFARAMGPVAITPAAGSAEVDASGNYRLDLEVGQYEILASAPGYVDGRDDPAPQKVAVSANQTTRGPDFELVLAATIQGAVKGLDRMAVIVATRRAPVPRDKRFTSRVTVGLDNGQYQLGTLKPGIYDLLLVSSELGLIDGRGSLLGEPDALVEDDRRAIEKLNSVFTRARKDGNVKGAMECISDGYLDADKTDYVGIRKRLDVLALSKQMGWRTDDLRWKTLLIQGTRADAMAVVHEIDRKSLRGSRQPLNRVDRLVQYAKERGFWRIRSIEPIREYTGLEQRIAGLTGEPCALAADYVAKYSAEPALGCILVSPGEKSRGHDFDLAPLLGRRR